MNKNRRSIFFVGFLLIVLLAIWLLRSPPQEQKAENPGVPGMSENPWDVDNHDRPEKSVPQGVPKAPVKAATEKKPAKISGKELEALRSLAKSTLSSAYTSQKAYRAEYERYSTDLKAVGWQPPEAEIKFKLGFISPYKPTEYIDGSVREEPNRMDTDAFLNEVGYDSEVPFFYSPNAGKINLTEYQSYCRSGCTANEKQFEYIVVVPLDDQGHVDVWLINDKKEIIHALDGAK